MVTKKQILAQLKELTDLIKSDKFNQLQKDSEELAEIKELLSHVKFKVKNVKYINDNESKTVQIIYELPKIILNVDENGNVDKNDFFYSTNRLEMISLEDMETIQDLLLKLKM